MKEGRETDRQTDTNIHTYLKAHEYSQTHQHCILPMDGRIHSFSHPSARSLTLKTIYLLTPIFTHPSTRLLIPSLTHSQATLLAGMDAAMRHGPSSKGARKVHIRQSHIHAYMCTYILIHMYTYIRIHTHTYIHAHIKLHDKSTVQLYSTTVGASLCSGSTRRSRFYS